MLCCAVPFLFAFSVLPQDVWDRRHLGNEFILLSYNARTSFSWLWGQALNNTIPLFLLAFGHQNNCYSNIQKHPKFTGSGKSESFHTRHSTKWWLNRAETLTLCKMRVREISSPSQVTHFHSVNEHFTNLKLSTKIMWADVNTIALPIKRKGIDDCYQLTSARLTLLWIPEYCVGYFFTTVFIFWEVSDEDLSKKY